MIKNKPDNHDASKLTVEKLNSLVSDAEVDWKSILTEESQAQNFKLEVTIKYHDSIKEDLDEEDVEETELEDAGNFILNGNGVTKDTLQNALQGIKGIASAANQANVFEYSEVCEDQQGIIVSTVATQKATWLKPFEEVAIRFDQDKKKDDDQDDDQDKAEAVQFWQVPKFVATCPAELKLLQAKLKDTLDQLNGKIKQYNANAKELDAILKEKLGGEKQLRDFFCKEGTIDHDSFFTRRKPSWTKIPLSQQSINDYFNEIIQKLEQEKKLDDALKEKIEAQQQCRIEIMAGEKQLNEDRKQAKCFDTTGHFLFYPGEKKSGFVDELYLIAPEGDTKQFDIDTKVYLGSSIYGHFQGKKILDQIMVESVSVSLKTKAQVDKEGTSVVQQYLVSMIRCCAGSPGFVELEEISPKPTQVYSFSCVFRYNDSAIQAVFLDGSKPVTPPYNSPSQK